MSRQPADPLHSIVHALARGVDPGRVLFDVVTTAVSATGATHGLVLAVVDGQPTPIVASGALHHVLVEAGERAVRHEQPSRRGDPAVDLMAVAVPVRHGARVLGALSIAGRAGTVDEAHLAAYADLAALALARRPGAATPGLAAHLDAIAAVGADLDRDAMLTNTLEAATSLFDARAGFVCLVDGDTAEVARYRAIARDSLRDAVSHPDFRAFVSAPTITVEPPTHPIVSRLTEGAEFAACVPLWAGMRRLGAVVLLLADAPEGERLHALEAFGRHVALALRSSTLWRRLQDHEEQLASVVHSMPNPVVVVDGNGRFTVLNGAAAELFGLSGTFDAGQPARGRLGQARLEALLLDDTPDATAEVMLGDPLRTYRAAARRVVSSAGRVLGRVLVLDDISEARASEQVKADFVAVIGHELRTPLTVVKGFVHALVDRGERMEPAQRAEAVRAIRDQATHLERLVDDLLFVSTEPTREPRVRNEPVDVRALVEHVVAGERERHPERAITVVGAAARLEATLDGAKVAQVLRHLLDNALKYSDDAVGVEVAGRDGGIEIAVVDAGPGIFSGDVPHLFERFRQLDGSNTRAHGGTGLGLYVCQRLVDAMGGRIWCDTRLGVGSRFAFRVPDASSAPPRPAVMARPSERT